MFWFVRPSVVGILVLAEGQEGVVVCGDSSGCGVCPGWLTASLYWVVCGVGAVCVFVSNEECKLIVARKICGVRNRAGFGT